MKDKSDTVIINEFQNLSFMEQVSLVTLHDLSDKALNMNEDYDKDSLGIKYTNPLFYPIKSRVPAIDLFQFQVEKDLFALKASKLRKNNNMFSNNLSRKQSLALKDLKENRNLRIRK